VRIANADQRQKLIRGRFLIELGKLCMDFGSANCDSHFDPTFSPTPCHIYYSLPKVRDVQSGNQSGKAALPRPLLSMSGIAAIPLLPGSVHQRRHSPDNGDDMQFIARNQNC
jgi:hypothetical protein